MQQTIRYCRRCRGNTDHWREGLGRRLGWRWVLFLPLLRLLDPWHCEVCELRDDDQADDD